MGTMQSAGTGGNDKLHAGAAWRQIRERFQETGDAVVVQSGLSAAIDRMSIEAFQSTLAVTFPEGRGDAGGGRLRPARTFSLLRYRHHDFAG